MCKFLLERHVRGEHVVDGQLVDEERDDAERGAELPGAGEAVPERARRARETIVEGPADGRPEHAGLARRGGRHADKRNVHVQFVDVQHARGDYLLGDLLVVLQVPGERDAEHRRHQPVERRVERLERQPRPPGPEPSRVRRGRQNARQVGAHAQRSVEFHRVWPCRCVTRGATERFFRGVFRRNQKKKKRSRSNRALVELPLIIM